LAIIFSTTAASSAGTSGRSASTDFGWRVWCQINFCATVPSLNGVDPVRIK
jgi:hypothetical protein